MEVDFMTSNCEIQFFSGNEELLEKIEFLWEELRDYHMRKSKDFYDHYASFNFKKRKADLLYKAKEGSMRIDIAKDKRTGQIIGYCISVIDKNNVGEIESFFVESNHRGKNIGDEFMKRALEWLDYNKVEKKKIGVAVGNEDVLDFYKRYGFHPRTIILEQK